MSAAGDGPRGDLADQATDGIFAAEQAAIRAALRREEGPVEVTDPRDASIRLPDEPELDLGDADDSDDAVHAGGDRVALSRSGAPEQDVADEVADGSDLRARDEGAPGFDADQPG